MEKPTWVRRAAFDRSTVSRASVATWAPKRLESLTSIIGDQTPERLRKAMVNELWATRGNGQTLTAFRNQIRAEEGLTDHH